jgi:hypothetical protein
MRLGVPVSLRAAHPACAARFAWVSGSTLLISREQPQTTVCTADHFELFKLQLVRGTQSVELGQRYCRIVGGLIPAGSLICHDFLSYDVKSGDPTVRFWNDFPATKA